MKIKTVIENRLPKRRIKDKKNKVLIALLVVIQIVVNQYIPFILGVYFALTGSAYLFAIFVFITFFELRISIDKTNTIKIKIIRGI